MGNNGLRYCPEVYGLRTITVLSVLLYHMVFVAFPEGFLTYVGFFVALNIADNNLNLMANYCQ